MFNKIEDPKDIKKFMLQSINFIIFGLFFGIIIDKLFQKLQNKYKLSKSKLIISQILFTIIFYYLLLTHVNIYAKHFQITIPGMLFPTFFFTVQFNLIKNLQEIIGWVNEQYK
jgi:hypothetical protein